MGGELSTCQVESCEPQAACRLDPSITPCGYFPHPGEPQQSRHGDVVWPLCDRARRGGTCGAYLLSARAKSEDAAQLDAGRRELELWLQAVVGHECKEAPWAQVQEDYWLQGHSSAAVRGPEGALAGGGPESLELPSLEQRAAAAQPPSSPSNARPASGRGSPAPKSPPTLVNIVALSQAQSEKSEEKSEEASNSGPPTASSSEATGSLQVEDAARGPGRGVLEEEAGGDGEASTEGNEEPASPVALETEAVLPQEVYGLSLYHISSVTPPRMRPEGRAPRGHCRGPPWPRPDGSPWPRPDGRARGGKQEARSAKPEACEPRPRPKPEACEAKQRPEARRPEACAEPKQRPEARSAKPAEAQEPKARGKARPRGGKANELLLW